MLPTKNVTFSAREDGGRSMDAGWRRLVSAPSSARFLHRALLSLSPAKLSRCLDMLLEEWSPSAPKGVPSPHHDEGVAIVRKVRGRLPPCRQAAEEEQRRRKNLS